MLDVLGARPINTGSAFFFCSNWGYHRGTVSDTSTAVSSDAEATTCSAAAETAVSAFLTTDTSESTGKAPVVCWCMWVASFCC